MGQTNNDDIYAHHWANADGTLAFTGQLNIVRIADGVTVYPNQPQGDPNYEQYWDATDPNKYYYYNGANLMVRDLAAQTSSIKKTFPSALQSMGGSLNFQTRDGRYFIVQYGGTAKVWDSQTDTIYSGSATQADPNGWISITPSGNHIVTAAGPNWEHYSYAIDHTAKSIAATPVNFWTACGDHGVLLSASDGKDYMVTFNCYEDPVGAFRVDVSKNQAGRSVALQRADNQLLVPIQWTDDGHFSAVSKGPLQDWVFFDTESKNSDFNGSTSGWTPYRDEIIAINIMTLQVRRLAHHRSRGMTISGNGYFNQPRVSCSWDGSVVLWTSNYNISSPTGYADMYTILLPIQ